MILRVLSFDNYDGLVKIISTNNINLAIHNKINLQKLKVFQ